MKLSDFSVDQLQAEIKRREAEAEEKAKPKMIENPDLTRLKDYLQYYIDHLCSEGREPKDAEYYTYEITVKTFFGKDVFDWINKKIG